MVLTECVRPTAQRFRYAVTPSLGVIFMESDAMPLWVSFSRTSERGLQTQLHTGVEKSLHYAEPPGDGLAPVKRYERLARGPGLS
ncbi:hypothetical protein RB195_000929 [Necator americanus]|uniref:Uncharacterized protein n=1 Tax=Necator americanus TaxID=51031 RepID=A0ABR1DBZ9_NECAM